MIHRFVFFLLFFSLLFFEVVVGGDMDGVDIEDLFEELEDLSDSGPEMDTMSISSTPKPSLRPFFSSSRSLLLDGLNTPGKLFVGQQMKSFS